MINCELNCHMAHNQKSILNKNHISGIIEGLLMINCYTICPIWF